MVREIVRDVLGEISADKLVITEDKGGKYVSLTMEEFEDLRWTAAQMVLDKEGETKKDRETAAALERARKAREEAEAIRQSNISLEKADNRLREQISKAGILADVVREGMQDVREPGEWELEAIGKVGQAYDTLRYGSEYEAMDSLEDVYLRGLRGKEQDERSSA